MEDGQLNSLILKSKNGVTQEVCVHTHSYTNICRCGVTMSKVDKVNTAKEFLAFTYIHNTM